ncbi:unnamed protein product [Urochloa decumbens]|uniref:Uncharacterized protein n=1 Tax=Urochloa decumbens TaxID=240449 RepID=A0ABC9H877_9POAL
MEVGRYSPARAERRGDVLSPADGAVYWLRWQVFVCGAFIALPAAAAAAAEGGAAPARRRPVGPLLGAPPPGLAPRLPRLRGRAPRRPRHLRLLLLHPVDLSIGHHIFCGIFTASFATAISAHGCWVYSRKSSRKADESHGFLNDDVENRGLPTPVSVERKKDETIKLPSYYEQIVNEKRAGFWGRSMQIIYQTSAGATMLTDITFWGLLVPFFYRDKFVLSLVTDGMHSLNAVFLLIDTVLNNMPFPWYRMAFFVFWSCAYVTFQWVLHACGGLSWWPYPFLDLSSSGAPIWYFGS